ncbi:hypothetical protein AB0D42_27930 [Streptomyces sp. NPDC048304]|uniref:hypothetical protein n=1 Tax=Streptomyces sp. NPDC048304 TaxID=3154820 RepID=UPI0033D115B3
MLRILLIALIGLYLMAVGIWPPAAAPVSLLLSGMAVLLGLIPKLAWLGAGIAAVARRDQPAPAVQPAD